MTEMRVIDPGHVYELSSLDGDAPQRLVFVKREGDRYPGNIGSHPGTTTQAVLRACIDRLRYVNSQVPCAETESAGNDLISAVLKLEIRAARVHGRALNLASIADLEAALCCSVCGHVQCEKHAAP
jgi:hypothetical protein